MKLLQGDVLEVLKTLPDNTVQLGRDFIGIDLNPDYIELARKRISNAPPYQETLI